MEPGLSSWRGALRRFWCQREWLSELGFVPLALIASWSLFAIKGVPLTHDGLGMVVIEAYRRAYGVRNYFPLWTVFGENGHGSALLILYHRLHAGLAAVLALKTGSVVAMKASIPFWLVVGGMGMRRLCRYHGARPWLAWIGGALLISAPYTLTDWYIRGATAELTAFMLVPWGLRYAAELLEADRRRWSAVRFAVASALIFYAHMLTFYFFVLTASVVVVGSLLRSRRYGWARVRGALGRCIAFVALLTCAIGPCAAAVIYFSEFTGVTGMGLRTNPNDFATYGAYAADPNYSWSRAVVEGQMSLEIGRWCLLCLGVFLLIAPQARRDVWRRAGGLALVALGFLALQHYGMMFWLEMLPGASKIQFPIRLLVFIVPITILCAAIATEAALRSSLAPVRLLAYVLPVMAAALQGNMTRGMQSAIWGFNIERSVVDTALADETNILAKNLSMNTAWDTFLPRWHGHNPPATPFLAASDGCRISSPTLTGNAQSLGVTKNVEGPVSFTVHGTNCNVKLNQVYSVLLTADFSRPGKIREADDAMTVFDVPVDGTVVRVHERSVMDLAKKFLVEKLGRRP